MGRAEDLFEKIRNEGESAVDFFIETGQSEELFLDFKRSTDNGSGTKLHDNDRWNLAKAISGFGNSEGGIIVWGVECSRNSKRGDVACSKVLIEQPRRFVSWLEGTVSGCTVPPHTRVTHIAIDSKDTEDCGYAVTLIPKSYDAPHQCLRPLQYFIRAGSDFVPTPHAVLAGMFGRRPQPFIFHNWSLPPAKLVSADPSRLAIQFDLGLKLSSWGPGLARDVYVSLMLLPPGSASRGGVSLPDQKNWPGYQSFGGVFHSLVSAPDFRLAPEMFAHPLNINLQLEPPFETDLHYRITFGHGGSPVYKIEARTSPQAIEKAILDFSKTPEDKEAARKAVVQIMQIEEKSQEVIQQEGYYSW